MSLLPVGEHCFLFFLQGTVWLFEPTSQRTTTILETTQPEQTLSIFAVIRLRGMKNALWVRDVLVINNKRVGILDFAIRMLAGRRYISSSVGTLQTDFCCAAGSITKKITETHSLHYFPTFPVSESTRVWGLRTLVPFECDGLYFVRGQTSIDYKMHGNIFHWYRHALCVVVTAFTKNVACIAVPPYDGSDVSEGVGYTLYIRNGSALVALGHMYTTTTQRLMGTILIHWEKHGWQPLPLARTRARARASTVADVHRVISLHTEGNVPEGALPSS
jgi:hypothetical protein